MRLKQILFCWLGLLINLTANALDFSVNGIKYSTTIDGVEVTGYSNISNPNLVLGETVTYAGTVYKIIGIGNNAFYGCTGLASITIPNSVTFIGNQAFKECNSLTSVVFPKSLISIGNQAFQYCNSLTSVIVSKSIRSIGDCAFANCKGLSTLIVETGNPTYDSRNNCNAVIETSSNELIIGCKNTIIPNSVTSIRNAFWGCTDLTSVTIPNSISSIGDCAFHECRGLTSITIPNSVSSIGFGAFWSSGLTSVSIPNSVTSIGADAFNDCKDLISIIIPNSVTSIGERAFFGCKSLTTIIALNPTPISISYNTFNYRANETLYVPDGRKSVYEAANIWKEFKEIKEITLNHSTTEIQIGEKLQLDATVLSEASGSSITWSSSDETIASVSVDGLVTANKLGTVTITATANNGSGIKEEWTITVKHVLIKEITLNEDSLELRLDRTYNLTANIIPENATFKEIIWSSSDESVAMVRDGKVTALKKGTAWITVTTTDGSNLSDSCYVKVTDIAASFISLDRESMELLIGDSERIVANIYPPEALQELAWTSSNSSIAVVKNGTVTGIKEGMVTITAKTIDGSNLSASCNVVVSKHHQKIEWNQKIDNIYAGGELVELRAQASSGLKVTFSSSNENVASIYDIDDTINLNPNNAGLVTITATQSGNDYWAAAGSVSKTIQVIDPDGIAGIMDAEQYEVYTLSGMKIGTYDQEEFQKIKQQLTKGVYILNGKKVVIR